jgi:ornithine cyclodeaminase/alanine dehydrogenase-like protein (mu-crystallin family)
MTLIISDDDVSRLLSMPECIAAMKTAFMDFSNGIAVNRPRVRYLAQHPDPERRYFANVHVGAVPSAGIACVRAGSQIMRPPNEKSTKRLYENPGAFNWGLVILYSIETAEPLALMHEFRLSGIRVGATTGMAIAQMTRPECSRLGLFGTGKQAGTSLEAILAVRPITEVKVYSTNAERLRAFVTKHQRKGVNITAARDAREVVSGADIISCATSSMHPVFDGGWLEPGQFVVTIANSDITNTRSEVDQTVFERASAIIVNDWESVVENQQIELTGLIDKGIVSQDKVHELGDVLTGKAQADLSGIVYYKNNSGLAIQFAAAGGIIYKKALAEGHNKTIPTEWLGSDLSDYYKAGLRPSP